MRSGGTGRPGFRPNFKPRTSTKPRTAAAAYGVNWSELSAYVRQRDGYRCRIAVLKPDWRCDVYAPPPFHHLLQAHHIIPVNRGGPNLPKNLISLCKECHGKLHGKYLGTITARQRAYVKRGPHDQAKRPD